MNTKSLLLNYCSFIIIVVFVTVVFHQQLVFICETPRRNKNYVDIYFEVGANIKGYWTYNHVPIQYEDCVDGLKFVYSVTLRFCIPF